MELDEVAAQLYAVPPEQFTTARDEQAQAARAAGRAQLAAEIRALRKPTQAAWLVNLLARERPDDLAGLLDLGAALREAQSRLQGDDLRRLSTQRGQVVSALARQAGDLARAAGRPAGTPLLREVEATLEAALADPAAAETVRAGRLTSALSYAGFGTPAEAGAVPTRAKRMPAAPAPLNRDRRDLSRLREAAAKAAKELEAAQAAVQAAEGARKEWQRRVQDQVEALEHARREEASAALDVREALRRQKTAVKSAQAAERRLAEARDRAT